MPARDPRQNVASCEANETHVPIVMYGLPVASEAEAGVQFARMLTYCHLPEDLVRRAVREHYPTPAQGEEHDSDNR